jgi:hypothetical protein
MLLAFLPSLGLAQAKAPIEADLSYKVRTGNSFSLDIDASVDSGYGRWEATMSIEVRCAKIDKQGTATISMTVQRYREASKSGGDVISFDTMKIGVRGEDEELTKVRGIVGKVIASAYIERDGRMHRVIWSEDGQTMWKEGGGSYFELLRDAVQRALTQLPGKVTAVGTTWNEERNPIGDRMPLTLKYTHKLSAFDPSTGRATITLASEPEAGVSHMSLASMTTKGYAESVVFDCAEGRLISSDLNGKFKAVFGAGDLKSETDYDYSVKVRVR